MIARNEAIKLNQTESKNLKDAIVTLLAANTTSLQAFQAALTQTVSRNGDTLNTLMNALNKRVDTKFSRLMDFMVESSSHKK